MPATLQVFCTETAEPLARTTQTYYGTGTYRYFHYCRCHNKKCVARCSLCGPVDYSNASKHVKQNPGHSLIVETTQHVPNAPSQQYQYTPRKKKKGELDSPPSLALDNEDLIPRVIATKDLLYAFEKEWITYHQQEVVHRILRGQEFESHDVQMLFKVLRYCTETGDVEEFMKSGLPMVAYYEFTATA